MCPRPTDVAPPSEHPPTVVVTRPRPGGRELAERLRSEGVLAELFPVLEIVPPPDPSPLRRAAMRVASGEYDWIVLTSANGVRALAAALAEPVGEPARGASGPGGRGLVPGARIVAVGPATAAAAEREGWRVDVVPETHTAEGVLDALRRAPSLEGARVLLPVAEAARDVLPRGLLARGARLDVIVAYRAVSPPASGVGRLRKGLLEGRFDLVTFASPSAAEGFLEALGEEALRLPAAVIGPVTGAAAERLGYRVVAVAEPHTADALAKVAARWALTSSRDREPAGEGP